MAKVPRTALLTALMFMVVNLSALLISVPFMTNEVASFQAFEDPSDPINPLLYIVALILMTIFMLLLIRFLKEKVLKYFILGSIFIALCYVFLLPSIYGISFLTHLPPYNAFVFLVGAAFSSIISFFLVVMLKSNPEWYVVNGIGILVASGMTAILGISLGILPAMILLIGLAIYDYVAVYKTKHMITLAEAVSKEKVPVMLVVPERNDYSLKETEGFKEEKKKVRKGKRDAMFIGLGDLVIPGTLTVSSFIFLPAKEILFGLTTNLAVAIFVFLGTMVGFYYLNLMIAKGKPHAGLPLLNGGAILFYMLSYLLFYQDFTFGLY